MDESGDRLAAVSRMGEEQDQAKEFVSRNLWDVDKLGTFDYVLCGNVRQLHGDGIRALHHLIGITKRKIVIALPDPSSIGVSNSDGMWRRFFAGLRDTVLPAICGSRSRRSYVKARNWAEDLLHVQRRDIAHFELVGPDPFGQYVLVASIRRLTDLALVSGPSGVGKSELVRRLRSGPEQPQLFGFDLQEGSEVLTAADLDKGREIRADRLLLQYDISRPFMREFQGYEADPTLTIMRAAERKRVYVLVCPRNMLVGRLLRRGQPKSHVDPKRARRVAKYSQPGGLRKLYDHWISHCKANGWDITYLDVGASQIQTLDEDQAMKLIGD